MRTEVDQDAFLGWLGDPTGYTDSERAGMENAWHAALARERGRTKAERPHLTEEQLRDVYEGVRKTGPRLGEVFKHLKTRNLYTVQGVALEKETLTPVVIYRRGYHEGAGHPTFTCPLSIWTPDRYAPVDREGDGL